MVWICRYTKCVRCVRIKLLMQEHMPAISDIILQALSTSTDGLLILNREKKVLFVNEVFADFFGLTPAGILKEQQNILSYIPINGGPELNRVFNLRYGDLPERQLCISYSEAGFGEDGNTLVHLVPLQIPDYAEWKQDVSRHLFENIQDPVMYVDGEGKIQQVNNSFTRILGYTRGGVLKAEDLYVDGEDFSRRLIALDVEDRLPDIETRLQRADEKILSFQETIWVHRNPGKQVLGYTSHLRDLSRYEYLKARLSVSQQNYNRLFEIITSSIIIVDELGIIININSSAEVLFGHNRADIIGQQYDDIFRLGSSGPSIKDLAQLTREHGGRYIDIGVPRKRNDGSHIYTYVTYFQLELEQEGGEVMFIMEKDLTDRINLEKQLEQSIVQVKEAQEATIIGFAKLTEYRDHCTGEHLKRIQEYTEALARELQRDSKYSLYISPEYIRDLSLSSVLHDIGKVGIEDSILLKTGALSKEEFDRMKRHARMGGDALLAIDNELGHESFFTIGRRVAYYHHEKWDGNGYPEELSGEEIPLSARIVALCDVYDALTSERPYKKAFPHDESVSIINKQKGKHFDPEIVNAFLRIQGKFKQIRQVNSPQT